MNLKQSISTGILRLKHLQEVTEAKGEEMAEERTRFDALRDREPVKAISSFNLFQTPEVVASQMAEELGPCDGLRVLEPSAGLGRLVRSVGVAGPVWSVVEQSAECCEELYKLGTAHIFQRDFLECSSEQLGGLFDRIIMNPPFKMGRDIKHIKHAMRMLKPHGKLVALCYDGKRQNEKLRPIVDTWQPLPQDSFRSEGTRARVVLVTSTASIPNRPCTIYNE